MPGSTPATSQLDWLSSTTAMIVLSWSKATRDLLKAFSWGIGALRQLFASDDGAISFAACPIPSLRWRETDSNPRSPIGSVRLWTVVVLDLHDLVAGTKGPAEDRGTFRRLCWVRGARDGGLRPARRASCQTGDNNAQEDDAVESPGPADTGHADGALPYCLAQIVRAVCLKHARDR